jgi:REP element-mobilizing transposase RayT
MRVQYPGAIYHVMSRGDRRENIFLSDVDRQDFLKTVAEACEKTGWQVHAYCLMSNHFHVVLETPNANLVDGMKWLLGTYTIRLNHRHKLFGHVFSGRYKSLVLDGSGTGYLRKACDYVHLNPVRAGLLSPQDRLLVYPWSSFGLYLTAPEHRPKWLRTDRLLGEHGIQGDLPEGRQLFEAQMEQRRLEDVDPEALKAFRRGWCYGSPEFRAQMLELLEAGLGENHSPDQRRETAEAKAERIIGEVLRELGCTAEELRSRQKCDPQKVALAARLRRETTLTVKAIAARLNLGTTRNATARLQEWNRRQRPTEPEAQAQPGI